MPTPDEQNPLIPTSLSPYANLQTENYLSKMDLDRRIFAIMALNNPDLKNESPSKIAERWSAARQHLLIPPQINGGETQYIPNNDFSKAVIQEPQYAGMFLDSGLPIKKVGDLLPQDKEAKPKEVKPQTNPEIERMMRVVGIQQLLRSRGVDWEDYTQEQMQEIFKYLGKWYGIKTDDLKYEDFEKAEFHWDGFIGDDGNLQFPIDTRGGIEWKELYDVFDVRDFVDVFSDVRNWKAVQAAGGLQNITSASPQELQAFARKQLQNMIDDNNGTSWAVWMMNGGLVSARWMGETAIISAITGGIGALGTGIKTGVKEGVKAGVKATAGAVAKKLGKEAAEEAAKRTAGAIVKDAALFGLKALPFYAPRDVAMAYDNYITPDVVYVYNGDGSFREVVEQKSINDFWQMLTTNVITSYSAAATEQLGELIPFGRAAKRGAQGLAGEEAKAILKNAPDSLKNRVVNKLLWGPFTNRTTRAGLMRLFPYHGLAGEWFEELVDYATGFAVTEVQKNLLGYDMRNTPQVEPEGFGAFAKDMGSILLSIAGQSFVMNGFGVRGAYLVGKGIKSHYKVKHDMAHYSAAVDEVAKMPTAQNPKATANILNLTVGDTAHEGNATSVRTVYQDLTTVATGEESESKSDSPKTQEEATENAQILNEMGVTQEAIEKAESGDGRIILSRNALITVAAAHPGKGKFIMDKVLGAMDSGYMGHSIKELAEGKITQEELDRITEDYRVSKIVFDDAAKEVVEQIKGLSKEGVLSNEVVDGISSMFRQIASYPYREAKTAEGKKKVVERIKNLLIVSLGDTSQLQYLYNAANGDRKSFIRMYRKYRAQVKRLGLSQANAAKAATETETETTTAPATAAETGNLEENLKGQPAVDPWMSMSLREHKDSLEANGENSTELEDVNQAIEDTKEEIAKLESKKNLTKEEAEYLDSLRREIMTPEEYEQAVIDKFNKIAGERKAGSVPIVYTHYDDDGNLPPAVREDIDNRVAESRRRMEESGIDTSDISDADIRRHFRATWFNGSVYVFLENATLDTDFDKILKHEVIGHEGIRRVLGAKFNEVLDTVYESAKDKELMDYIKGLYNIDTSTAEGRRQAADEYLAFIAQSIETAEPGLLKKLVLEIRKALRTLFPNLKLSDDEIVDLIRRSAENIASAGSEQYNPDGTVRHLLGGKIGAERLDVANGNRERMEKLAEATAQEQFETKSGLWKKFGWERGRDDEWRTEIKDFKFKPKYDPTIAKNASSLYNKFVKIDATLEDIIDADELFTAYPELRKTKIAVDDKYKYFGMADTADGMYIAGENKIVINRNGGTTWSAFNTVGPGNTKDFNDIIKGTIVHEIQHAIQHAEGFAIGSNTRNAAIFLNRNIEIFRKALGSNYENANASIDYMKAKVPQANFELDDILSRADHSDELRKYLESKIGENASEDVKEELDNLYNSTLAINRIERALKDPRFAYLMFAGESEARNVEKRSLMTDKERAERAPFETEKDQEPFFDAFPVPRHIQIKMMFTPVRHLIGGDIAAERLGKMDKRQDAEEMYLYDGESEKSIWSSTGFQLGRDGKWRHEIKDIALKLLNFKKDADSKNITTLLLNGNKPFSIRDVVDDDELFKAYPELEDYTVQFAFLPDKYRDDAARTDTTNKKILVNLGYDLDDVMSRIELGEKKSDVKRAVNELRKEFELTLSHEIQHAIQAIEGFQRGTSPELMESLDLAYDPVFMTVLKKDEALHKDYAKARNKIRNDLNRVEELAKKAVGRIREEDREEVDMSISLFVQEIYDAADNENKFIAGEVRNVVEGMTFSEKSKDEMMPELVKIAKRLKAARAVKESIELNVASRYDVDADILYWRAAGEVEARNVEKRFGMSEKQRAEKPLSATESFDRSQQIVIPDHIYNVLSTASISLMDENLRFQNKTEQNGERGARGAFASDMFTSPSASLIALFKNADASTLPHELAHWLYSTMKFMVDSKIASDDMVEDWNTIQEWMNQQKYSKGTGTEDEREEKFAAAIERYLFDGKFPEKSTSKFKTALQTLRKWIINIYHDIRENSHLNLVMTPDIKEFFDKLFVANYLSENESLLAEMWRDIDPDILVSYMSKDSAKRMKKALEEGDVETANKIFYEAAKGWQKRWKERKPDAIEEGKESYQNNKDENIRNFVKQNPLSYEFLRDVLHVPTDKLDILEKQGLVVRESASNTPSTTSAPPQEPEVPKTEEQEVPSVAEPAVEPTATEEEPVPVVNIPDKEPQVLNTVKTVVIKNTEEKPAEPTPEELAEKRAKQLSGTKAKYVKKQGNTKVAKDTDSWSESTDDQLVRLPDNDNDLAALLYPRDGTVDVNPEEPENLRKTLGPVGKRIVKTILAKVKSVGGAFTVDDALQKALHALQVLREAGNLDGMKTMAISRGTIIKYLGTTVRNASYDKANEIAREAKATVSLQEVVGTDAEGKSTTREDVIADRKVQTGDSEEAKQYRREVLGWLYGEFILSNYATVKGGNIVINKGDKQRYYVARAIQSLTFGVGVKDKSGDADAYKTLYVENASRQEMYAVYKKLLEGKKSAKAVGISQFDKLRAEVNSLFRGFTLNRKDRLNELNIKFQPEVQSDEQPAVNTMSTNPTDILSIADKFGLDSEIDVVEALLRSKGEKKYLEDDLKLREEWELEDFMNSPEWEFETEALAFTDAIISKLEGVINGGKGEYQRRKSDARRKAKARIKQDKIGDILRYAKTVEQAMRRTARNIVKLVNGKGEDVNAAVNAACNMHQQSVMLEASRAVNDELDDLLKKIKRASRAKQGTIDSDIQNAIKVLRRYFRFSEAMPRYNEESANTNAIGEATNLKQSIITLVRIMNPNDRDPSEYAENPELLQEDINGFMDTLSDWMRETINTITTPSADKPLRVNYRELTMEQFRDLKGFIELLDFWGRYAVSKDRADEIEKLKSTSSILKDQLGKVKNGRENTEMKWNDKNFKERMQFLWDSGFYLTQTFSSLLERWDGYAGYVGGGEHKIGAFERLLGLPMYHGEEVEQEWSRVIQKETVKPLLALMKSARDNNYRAVINNPRNRAFRTDSDGLKVISGKKMAFVLLNAGNEEGRERLKSGFGWTDAQLTSILNQFSEEDINNANEIWKSLNKMGVAVAEAHYKRTHTRMKWVNPVEIIIEKPDGKVITSPGGYYPIGYTYVDSWSSGTNLDEKKPTEVTSFGVRNTHTLERARKTGEQSLELDQFVLMGAIHENARYLGMAEPLRFVGKIVRNPEFKRAMIESQGVEAYRSFTKLLEHISRPEHDNTALAKLFRWMKLRLATLALAYKARPVLKQGASATVGLDRFGRDAIKEGMVAFATHPRELARFVCQKSAIIQARYNLADRDLSTIGKEFSEGIDKLETMYREWGYKLMKWNDINVAVFQWYIAYNWAKNYSPAVSEDKYDKDGKLIEKSKPQKLLESKLTDEEAIAYADNFVSGTQGSATGTATPLIKTSAWGDFLTPFMSAAMASARVRMAGIAAFGKMSLEERIRFLFDNFCVPAFTMALIEGVWAGIFGGGDGDDDKDKALNAIWRQLITEPISGIPIVQDVADTAVMMAQNGSRFGARNDTFELSALRVPNDAVYYGGKIIDSLDKPGYSVYLTLSALGEILGIPAVQLMNDYSKFLKNNFGVETLEEAVKDQ